MQNARTRHPKNDAQSKVKSRTHCGRPTEYREIYAGLAKKFFILNQEGTDADLAAFLDVAESTIHLWKQKHPKFSESIKDGKSRANAEVAFSLYKRATGYDTTVQKVVNGELQDCIEHVPGDVQAQRLFLSNRTHWRDKQAVEHSGAGGAAIQVESASALDLRALAIARGLLKPEGN